MLSTESVKPGMSGFIRVEPIFKDKVLTIVRMRLEGKTYQEIAQKVGGSRMNALSAYKRWHTWAIEELRIEALMKEAS